MDRCSVASRLGAPLRNWSSLIPLKGCSKRATRCRGNGPCAGFGFPFFIRSEFLSTDDLKRAIPNWITEEVNVTREWLLTLQTWPVLWLRAKRGSGKKLAAALGDCAATDGMSSDALEYHGEEDLFRTPEFQAGEFEVQDIASHSLGLLCAPQPGQTWWDACAGEGGKMLHLSDLMQNKGLIWASDRSERRLSKLRQRTARAKVFNYRAVPWDGLAKLPTKNEIRWACSSMRHAPESEHGKGNPHARWTTTMRMCAN